MRTLILHIGAHKTGTSSIQHYLKRSQARLIKANWRFIYLPGSLNLAQLLTWDKEAPPNFRLREWALKRLAREVDDCTENCIMSGEDLFFLDKGVEIQRLQQTLAPLFDRIEVIVYLRRQDRMAVSLKAQGAKTIQANMVFGHTEDPLPELTPAVQSYMNYQHKLALWADCFGRDQLRVRIFEPRQLEQGDAVLDFLKQTNLPLNRAPLRRNESLGEDATCFLQTLRQEGIAPSAIWPLYRAGFIERRGGGLRKPTRQKAEAFVQHFSASNKTLGHELGMDPLFSDDFQTYPDTISFPRMDQAYARRNCAMMSRRLARFCGARELHTVTTAARLLADQPALAAQLRQVEATMKAYLQYVSEATRPETRPAVVETDELWHQMQLLIVLSQAANDTHAQVMFKTAKALRNNYPRLAYKCTRMAWRIRPYGVDLENLLAALRARLKRLKRWTLSDEATRLWLQLDYFKDVAQASIRAKFNH